MTTDHAAGTRSWPSRFALYGMPAPQLAHGWAIETVVAPNPLYGANGIRIAPDGSLWITQVNGDHITAWVPSTGELVIADPMGSPMGGPDDVAFDAAGNCYVTETLNNKVSARRGDDYVVLLEDTRGPNGITIDPTSDRLFVDEMAEGGRVLELDRERPGSVRVIAEGLDWLNALERGADGRLYVPQVFAGQVIAVDIDSGAVEVVAADLALPTAVKFHPDGSLVVSEAAAGTITAIDLATGERRPLCRPGPGIDNLCFDAEGALYTSNFVETRVERWSAGEAQLVDRIAPGGLIGPASVAAWDGDGLIVADHNSIVRVHDGGRLERLTTLLGNQQFVADAALRVGGTIVALTLAGEVVTIDPATGATTKLVEATGSMNDQLLGLSAKLCSALASDGTNVLAAIGHDVVAMRPDGSERTTTSFGETRIDAIAATGDLLAVADRDAGTVVVRAPHGDTVVDGLEQPEAIAFHDGALFVAETAARRITRVALDGTRRDAVVESAPIGMPQPCGRLGRSASLHADAGAVYIGCDGDGSILRLSRV